MLQCLITSCLVSASTLWLTSSAKWSCVLLCSLYTCTLPGKISFLNFTLLIAAQSILLADWLLRNDCAQWCQQSPCSSSCNSSIVRTSLQRHIWNSGASSTPLGLARYFTVQFVCPCSVVTLVTWHGLWDCQASTFLSLCVEFELAVTVRVCLLICW